MNKKFPITLFIVAVLSVPAFIPHFISAANPVTYTCVSQPTTLNENDTVDGWSVNYPVYPGAGDTIVALPTGCPSVLELNISQTISGVGNPPRQNVYNTNYIGFNQETSTAAPQIEIVRDQITNNTGTDFDSLTFSTTYDGNVTDDSFSGVAIHSISNTFAPFSSGSTIWTARYPSESAGYDDHMGSVSTPSSISGVNYSGSTVNPETYLMGTGIEPNNSVVTWGSGSDGILIDANPEPYTPSGSQYGNNFLLLTGAWSYPSAIITANPTQVASGASSTLKWKSINSTSCSGTNFSTGGATSSSAGVSTGPLSATESFGLNCVGGFPGVPGATGNSYSTATVAVVSTSGLTSYNRACEATPKVGLRWNPTWTPLSSTQGYRVYRSTSATGTFSEITGPSPAAGYANPYVNYHNSLVDFTDVTGALTAGRTYYYEVSAYDTGTNQSSSPSAPVSAVASSPCSAAPTVILSASPNPVTSGNPSTLTWTVSDPSASCTASGAWSGSKSASGGSQSTGNLTSPKTYTLACTNSGGTGTGTVTVGIGSPTPTPETGSVEIERIEASSSATSTYPASISYAKLDALTPSLTNPAFFIDTSSSSKAYATDETANGYIATAGTCDVINNIDCMPDTYGTTTCDGTYCSIPINVDLGAAPSVGVANINSNDYFTAVASNENGSKIVGVSDNYNDANGGNIYASYDGGTTWTALAGAPQAHWVAVSMSADGQHIVAGSNGLNNSYQELGQVYTSNDGGNTWTDQTSLGTEAWTSVAYSPDGSELFVTDSYSNFFVSRDHGATWSSFFPTPGCDPNQGYYPMGPGCDQDMPATSFSFSNDSSLLGGIFATRNQQDFVSIFNSLNGGLAYSSDPSDPGQNYVSGAVYFNGLVASNNGSTGREKFAALQQYGEQQQDGSYQNDLYLFYNFPNGGWAWTVSALPSFSSSTYSFTPWKYITMSSDGQQIAVAAPQDEYGDDSYIETSSDGGGSWTPLTIAGLHDWVSIAYSADGTKFVAVASDNYVYSSAVSPNGLSNSGTVNKVVFKYTKECANGTTLTQDEAHNAIWDGRLGVAYTINSPAGKSSAKITNNTSCAVPLSLLSYQMYDQDLGDQTFYDASPETGSTTVAAGTNHTFTVNIPACMTQIDLYYGTGPQVVYSDNRAEAQTLSWDYFENSGTGYADAGPSANFCSAGTPSTLLPSCSASPTGAGATTGTLITWSSSVSGGQSPYLYSWTGANLSSSNANTSQTYNTTGVQTATLTVTDSNNTSSSTQCSVTINPQSNNSGSIQTSCMGTPPTTYLGQTVTWTATSSGGTAPYTYYWVGGPGSRDTLAGLTGATIRKTYVTTGQKTAFVTSIDNTGAMSSSTQCVTSSTSTAVNVTVNPISGEH